MNVRLPRTSAPIESKVYAATIGAAAGSQIAHFVLWVVGVSFFGGPLTSAGADLAVGAVPGPVATFVTLAVSAGCTFLGGWLARHSPRLSEEARQPEGASVSRTSQ